MAETPGDRLRRLRMRSWRRGMKEMDLILGPFADARLPDLAADQLDLYDRLLAENDQDLYRWVTGQTGAPAELAALIEVIAAQAGASRAGPAAT